MEGRRGDQGGACGHAQTYVKTHTHAHIQLPSAPPTYLEPALLHARLGMDQSRLDRLLRMGWGVGSGGLGVEEEWRGVTWGDVGDYGLGV